MPPPDPQPGPTEPTDEPDKKNPGLGLIVAGAVLTGVGLGVGVGGTTAFGLRAQDRADKVEQAGTTNPDNLTLDQVRSLDDEGQQAETLQIVMGAVGGALAVTGIALIAVGAVKRKKAKKQTALAPSFGPGYAGIALSGRF